MLFHAVNGTVSLPEGELDYVRFGTGKKNLVLLPGLGDGLRTVKGTALPMALMYREFAGEYTVYVFSRRNHLPQGCTIREMARDKKLAMDRLGIENADVVGVSMGGMIAQYLAIDYPEKVGKLVLAVTSSRPNPVIIESVTEWMDYARRDDHIGLMDSNVKRMYSDVYYRKNKWMVPLMGKLTKPNSYERFLIMAQACLAHDAWAELPRIRAATLVIGGEQDKALGGQASRDIAQQIPGAQLRMYEKWGHGLYEEEKGFNAAVLTFLKQVDGK